MPGNGKLILTGQLGDVMKESAQAALSLLKSQAARLGIDTTVFDKSDVHIHRARRARFRKDGPSARCLDVHVAGLAVHQQDGAQ